MTVANDDSVVRFLTAIGSGNEWVLTGVARKDLGDDVTQSAPITATFPTEIGALVTMCGPAAIDLLQEVANLGLLQPPGFDLRARIDDLLAKAKVV